MRIVGGKHRGRRLAAPSTRGLRPTADRTRQALFNILEHGIDGFDVDGTSVIDVFAGTGALGLEALSRGAAHVTFIDNSGDALAIIRKNATTIGEAANITLLTLDATRLPPPPLAAQAPAGLAFLDPPYGSDLASVTLNGLSAKGWLDSGSICIIEIAAKEKLTPPPPFESIDERAYGAARLVFLRMT